MIHNEAAEAPEAHWSVSHNGIKTHVLVQVQSQHGDHARTMLTAQQAHWMIKDLQKALIVLALEDGR